MQASGKKIMVVSALAWIASAAPLMLYALLGPRDGNPIGLGLLFFFGSMAATIGLVVGLVLWVIGKSQPGRRP